MNFDNTKWDAREWTEGMKTKWQEKMFSLGYAWGGGDQDIRYLDAGFYCVYGDKCITFIHKIHKRFARKFMTEKTYADAFPELARDNFDEEFDAMFAQQEAKVDSDNVEVVNELSGGSCNYYTVSIDKPTTLQNQYTVECNDLIESLGLTWQEANIYKEIFRTANERTHSNGKQGNTPKRAAEKVLFFAVRHAMLNGVDVEKLIKELKL